MSPTKAVPKKSKLELFKDASALGAVHGYGLGVTEDIIFENTCKRFGVEPSVDLAKVYASGLNRGEILANRIHP